jgi:hypothetical protein
MMGEVCRWSRGCASRDDYSQFPNRLRVRPEMRRGHGQLDFTLVLGANASSPGRQTWERSVIEEIMEVPKRCVGQGVQTCDLGVPILGEEIAARSREEVLAG